MGIHFAKPWNDIGRPYQGELFWKPEQNYGTTSTVSDCLSNATHSVSSVVMVARVDTNEVNRYFRGIDSIDISAATKKCVDYTLHLEYLPQHHDFLADFLCDRSSGTIRSLTFQLGANTSTGTGTYYLLNGCKCKNMEVAGTQCEPWTISADFSVKSIATSTTSTLKSIGSKFPSVVSGDLCMFNVASHVTNSAGLSLAYVTNSFSMTINHNLQDLWTVGDRDKQAAIECARDVTGSSDISLDEGGGFHFGDVLNAEKASLRVYLAEIGSGAPRFDITDLRWDSSSIDVGDVSEGMMESAPFTAKSVSCNSC